MKEENNINWSLIVFLVLFFLMVIFILFVSSEMRKEGKEAKQFCESELNGELSLSSNRVCYVEQNNTIYEVKIMKYKGEWRVFSNEYKN